MRSFLVLSVVALTVLGPVAAQSGARPDPKAGAESYRSGRAVPAGAVAIIGDRSLLIGEFSRSVYERYIGREQGGRVLQDLVQRRLIETNMKKSGVEVTKADLDRHYAEVDQQYRNATQGKMTIADVLKQEGLSPAEFRQRLRLQLALKKMASRDFKREDISPADQQQWLRSKMLDAKVEQDPSKLPERAAARVYGDFITFEDFAREVLGSVPPREALGLVRTRLEAMHALQMLSARGITYDEKARKAAYVRFKTQFESDPKYQNIPFADFIRERSGMTIDAYMKGPVFTRQAALHLLGAKLVSDDAAPARYQEMKEFFGPQKHVRHIFLRADENRNNKDLIRSFPEAKKNCDAILARIRNGEKFDEMVQVYSEDGNSKFKGGTLDVFTPASARKFANLAPVLETMKPGDIRGPIKSQRGYHVIKLQSVKPAPALSPQIVDEIRKRVAVEAFLESFRKTDKGVDLKRFLGRS